MVHYNNDGRASGEADVDFATHDEAKEAMRKDRGTMREYNQFILVSHSRDVIKLIFSFTKWCVLYIAVSILRTKYK